VVPATSWLLCLLALKLTRTRRVSHVDDLLADPAAALLAGLATIPKKSALTAYSWRTCPTTPRMPTARHSGWRPASFDRRQSPAAGEEAVKTERPQRSEDERS
jgi:hypothetical protein